ncbi:MAG: hypothetical protein EOP21_00380 [Hyphomicrobiales bacterium]|nr:MAG: hypothetical protein EOP21_00380 [Hyphomicrobiales bacterium]
MTSRIIEELLGRGPTNAPAAHTAPVAAAQAPSPKAGDAEAKDIAAALVDDAAEPETYRPYFPKPHPQLMFSLIERDGTEWCFQYFTLRHLRHQTRNGEEFVSFVADGQAVVMQGSLLRVVLLGLKRYALSEVREYDGRPAGELPTRIDRLEIQDVPEQMARPAPRLVK